MATHLVRLRPGMHEADLAATVPGSGRFETELAPDVTFGQIFEFLRVTFKLKNNERIFLTLASAGVPKVWTSDAPTLSVLHCLEACHTEGSVPVLEYTWLHIRVDQSTQTDRVRLRAARWKERQSAYPPAGLSRTKYLQIRRQSLQQQSSINV